MVWGACARTHFGKQPLSIAREKLPSTNPISFVVSCSKSDRDETLAIMLAKQSTRQLNRSTKTINHKLQSSNAKEVIIEGCPEVGKAMVKKPLKANNKRAMQPFAMSPIRKQNVRKKNLNVCQSFSKRKMKLVYGNEESIGKAIIKVKKERKNNKPRRSVRRRQKKKDAKFHNQTNE